MRPDPEKPTPLDYFNPMNGPKRRSIFLSPLLWMVGVPLGLCVVATLLLRYSNLSEPRIVMDDGLGMQTMRNLREIGQGIHLYTSRFHGDYPDSFQTLFIIENEDGLNEKVFVSPLRGETSAKGARTQEIASHLSGSHLSYVYLGKGLSTATLTTDTIVAYELPTDSSSGTFVILGYGSVEHVDSITTAKIIAEASAGNRPVTMPSDQ